MANMQQSMLQLVAKMAPTLMLFENKNYGYGNRTVTGETFVSKCMVTVNAYHKEGFYFIFYGTIRARPSCASCDLFMLD